MPWHFVFYKSNCPKRNVWCVLCKLYDVIVLPRAWASWSPQSYFIVSWDTRLKIWYTAAKARNPFGGGDYSNRGFSLFSCWFIPLHTFLAFVNQLKAIYPSAVSHAAVTTNFAVIEQLEEGGNREELGREWIQVFYSEIYHEVITTNIPKL